MKRLFFGLCLLALTTNLHASPIDPQFVDDFNSYLDNYRQEAGVDTLLYTLVTPQQTFHCILGEFENETDREALVNRPLPFFAGQEPLESLLLARLASEDKLDLEDALDKAYPAYRGQSPIPTLSQLMTLTGGLPDYADKRMSEDWFQPADTFSLIEQTPRARAPGEEVIPSRLGSYAAALAGVYAVKHRDHRWAEDYRSVFQDEVFEKLGMATARFSTEVPLHASLELSLEDAARWIQAELEAARQTNAEFALPGLVQQRWQPVRIKGRGERGMGWTTQVYQATEIIARGGPDQQSNALMGLLPRHGIGFFVWIPDESAEAARLLEELPLALVETVRQE